MLLVLLLLRTAISALVGVLIWYVAAGALTEALPSVQILVPVFLGGMVGGMTCASLNPSRALPLASTAGVMLTVLGLGQVLRAGGTPEGMSWVVWYWPFWVTPAYVAGVYLWLALARMILRD